MHRQQRLGWGPVAPSQGQDRLGTLGRMFLQIVKIIAMSASSVLPNLVVTLVERQKEKRLVLAGIKLFMNLLKLPFKPLR